MLQPTRTKFRKAHKGRIHGTAKAGTELNFGQYLLARRQGELPITGSDLDPNSLVTPQGFRRGEVIVLDLSEGQTAAGTTLDELLTSVARDHLSAVSVDNLLRSASAN